jgi:23S rRNA (guanosine2251-2'-O)-methyltransferase
VTATPSRRLRLVLHNVRSLWNVGAMFRTADALQVETLHLCGFTGTPPRKEIEKTALGADAWVPWHHHAQVEDCLQQLRRDGWTLLALELTPSAIPLHTYVPTSDKLCLVVGHEISGVADSLCQRCDVTVQIPMLGHKESLNVAVATGIALHQLRFSERDT